MQSFRAFLLVGCLSFLVGAQEDFVELTSTEGTTIEVKIIAATGTEVEIELKDGRRFTMPHTRFSLTSREIIRGTLAGGDHPGLGRPDPSPQTALSEPPFAFKGFSFRESETQHFRFMSLEGSPRDVRGVAEQIFVLMTPRLSGIRDRFEQGGFRAPGERRNPADFQQGDGTFRYTIHLVGDAEAYQAMVRQYAEAQESRQAKDFLLATAPGLGQFTDFKNRFSVALDDGQTDMVGLVAHQIGFQLVSIDTESLRLPLWLRMGAGYYAEHKAQGRCTVFYADYTAYDDSRYRPDGEGGGFVDPREVLSHEDSWVDAVRKMCRQNLPVGLERMLTVKTGDLTPVESAFSLALFSYCTSGVNEVKAFQQILEKVGKREDATPEVFARIYGFESVEAFDTAWREFILSRKFR